MTGIELIAKERQEQIDKHGRDSSHDAAHNDDGQLIDMAAHLLMIDRQEGIDRDMLPVGWDEDTCIYMLLKPRKERLVIAGALIAAELDRLEM